VGPAARHVPKAAARCFAGATKILVATPEVRHYRATSSFASSKFNFEYCTSPALAMEDQRSGGRHDAQLDFSTAGRFGDLVEVPLGWRCVAFVASHSRR
jgi:hypothetical protein